MKLYITSPSLYIYVLNMLARIEKSKRKKLRHLHRAKQAGSDNEITCIKEEKMLSKENNKHRPCAGLLLKSI
jgi:hypothetical protein